MSERELCSRCEGNGVVKIPGGVSVCSRCMGRCYEPSSPCESCTSIRAELERVRAERDERLSLQRKKLHGEYQALWEREEQEAILALQRAEAAESRLSTLRAEIEALVQDYPPQHKSGCANRRAHYTEDGTMVVAWPGERPCDCGLSDRLSALVSQKEG